MAAKDPRAGFAAGGTQAGGASGAAAALSRSPRASAASRAFARSRGAWPAFGEPFAGGAGSSSSVRQPPAAPPLQSRVRSFSYASSASA